MTDWFFDALLAAGLLGLGWRSVATPDLFRAVLLFIIFGLFMALCWARLEAPDVALAEAAIGAGLTGALLLEAYRHFAVAPRDKAERHDINRGKTDSVGTPLLVVMLALSLIAALGWALLGLPESGSGPGELVYAHLPQSGVSNPVTAVLLNFRGYDTLLEVAVLLLALIGTWAVNCDGAKPAKRLPASAELLLTLLRLLAPMAVLTAGYLLWAGAHAPGGAFQAGAVLAALGVLVYLSGRLEATPASSLSLRALLVLGLGVFCLVALGTLALGGRLLEYPPAWAGALILLVESALTLSIALILVLLFAGVPGLAGKRP